MISALFTQLGTIATNLGTLLTSVFNSVVSMFYGGEPAALTDLGTLALIAAASGLVFWGFSFVLKLLRIGSK
jgi:uncharacterized YccA/Bax inhibitor family protein